jgi:hypothetical protein
MGFAGEAISSGFLTCHRAIPPLCVFEDDVKLALWKGGNHILAHFLGK